MKKRALSLLFLLLGSCLLVACGSTSTSGNSSTPTPSPVTLTIFAASSLKTSFNALADQYHTLHPNVTIKPVYDSSATLEQQLANGAPADIFASADTTNMQKASQANLVDSSQIFAKNRLVVILPASNPGHLSTLKDLANSGVKIDVANQTVPVGKYALQVLNNMGQSPAYGPTYEAAVLKNVVSQEQNDAAIVQKVQLGEVDAGIVYVSDINPANAAQFISITIPDNFNVIAQYPIAVVKTSIHSSDAQAFIQYVLSPAGQGILKQYNFIPMNQ
jgi:molybdate transport system substrate-binding protein